MMSEIDEHKMTVRALALSRIIAPVLYGEPSYVQGAVLADLMSVWIAGHQIPGDPAATDEVRREFLADWLETVWQLVPASEKQIKEMDNG